jgi:DNA polymerase
MANDRIVHNSGDWGFNMQNLPRKGALRKALRAPKDHIVMTVDAAQIEARIVVWLNGALKLLTAFANKEDVYSVFASQVFGYPVSKAEHPDQRFVGKQGVLGLGFGMGYAKFVLQLAKDSRLQTGKEIKLTDAEGIRIVGIYRNQMAPEVRDGWKFLEQMLFKMASGNELPQQWGPVTFEHQRIRLPNGMCLYYPDLARNPKGEWTYKSGYTTKYLFGGKLMENIVQALARICTMEAALRIQAAIKRLGEGLVLQVHDENAYVVPAEFETVMRHILETEMRRTPEWAPGLPLDCEIGVGLTYGDAK